MKLIQNNQGQFVRVQIPPEELVFLQPTPYELAMQNWHYPEWAMRIAIPLDWFDPAFTGISEETKAVIEKFWVWWNAMEFPTERVGDVRYGYCNTIQPHHEQFLENLGIVPENRPEPSDYE